MLSNSASILNLAGLPNSQHMVKLATKNFVAGLRKTRHMITPHKAVLRLAWVRTFMVYLISSLTKCEKHHCVGVL